MRSMAREVEVPSENPRHPPPPSPPGSSASSSMPPEDVKLLDLPDELFEHIFLRAANATPDSVPFASWYLAGVSQRFKNALYDHVQRVSLASCFEQPRAEAAAAPVPTPARNWLAAAPAAVLSGALLRCRALSHLDVTGCDALSDAQLIRFLRAHTPPLRSFTACICLKQTDSTVCTLAGTAGARLESLDLSGCDRYRHTAAFRRPRPRPPYRPCRALSDAALFAVAQHCGALRAISLSSAVGITDAGLSALAALDSLQVLKFRRLTEITDVGVAALANGRGRIHTFHLLSVGAVTDQGLIAVAHGVATRRHLRSVAISFNYQVTDRAVRALLENAPLEEMRCDHCALLSESWTMGLKRSYDRLHTVSLRGVSLDISSRGIRNLAQLTRLKSINLGFVASITANVLRQLKQCAPYLDTLILEACSKVDNAAAEQLADFPRITTLDVSWCSKLAEDGLLAIVRGATGRRLTHFVLGPVNVPEDARRKVLYELGSTCTNLETLVLCGEVDEATLQWLRVNSTASVDYADVIFRSSKRRTSTASNTSGMSE